MTDSLLSYKKTEGLIFIDVTLGEYYNAFHVFLNEKRIVPKFVTTDIGLGPKAAFAAGFHANAVPVIEKWLRDNGAQLYSNQ